MQKAQALLEHPPQEERIADEVAPPETAWFDDEPGQPLKIMAGHPAGGMLGSALRFALYFALQQAI